MTLHRSSIFRTTWGIAIIANVFSCLLGFSSLAFADPSSVVINKYAVLDVDAKRGDSTFIIRPPSDPNVPAITSLSSGDLLLLIQMQGATVKVPADKNDPTYGELIHPNGAGLYELVKVESYTVDGNGKMKVTLHENCKGLRNSYSQAAHTQVVLMPQSQNFTVASNTYVTSPAWDGNVGGIVALQTGTLTMNGNIDVSGKGFKGGSVSMVSPGNDVSEKTTLYYSTSAGDGGAKGESIAGGVTECVARGDCFGRGAIANGGGGGNNHGAAGGGGSNAGNGNAFTGQGVMDPAYEKAWMLDPAYAGRLSNSSGGGRGGYSASGVDTLSPLLVGPGDARWLRNFRREVGGLGGRVLPYGPALDRLFLGGGGGAGHANNLAGGSGGQGGGIVLILANFIWGQGKVIANGAQGEEGVARITADWLDGPGGGGGGGTIVVYSDQINGVELEAKGGQGGNQRKFAGAPFDAQSNSGGGGGGGGKIAVSQKNAPTARVYGGLAGVTNAHAMTAFPMNGATGGASGSIDLRVDLAADGVAVCQEADLALELIPIREVASTDQTFSYKVVVRNIGPSRAANALVSGVLSKPILGNLTWTCEPLALCGKASGIGDINTNVTLEKDETVTLIVTVPAPFDPGTETSLVYTATVFPPLGMTDPDLENNSKTTQTPILQGGPGTGVRPDKYQLSGGGFSGGCQLSPTGSAGSLLEVFVLAAFAIVGRISRQMRRQKN